MRLINTTTFRLEEFPSVAIPPYAILSHRWGPYEASIDDFSNKRSDFASRNEGSPDEALTTAGYQKIRSFCDIARQRGLQYAWVDTCCIEKRSSQELSEAIVSMASWYRQADVCIVYLSDVSSSANDRCNSDVFQQLEMSDWFTRGWTLQELLEPRRLVFYSSSWKKIGSLNKEDTLIGQPGAAPLNLSPSRRGFLTSLERASHIKIRDLCVENEYRSASTAQRMFWASHRQTTKVEDTSYSLMGLFDVSMSCRYGEGLSQSFVRLQCKIAKRSTDESLFAWTSPASEPTKHNSRQPLQHGNVLAASPAEFSNSNDVERTPVNLDRAMVFTSNGIDLYRDSDDLCIFRRQRGQHKEQLLYIIKLGCERGISGQLTDPCVIALLTEIRKGTSSSNVSINGSTRSPITIQRRVMNNTLKRMNTSALLDLGFESVHAAQQSRYHFWLPFENVLPRKRDMRRMERRKRTSLL